MRLVPAARPYFDPESRARVLRRLEGILESGQLTMGPLLAEFEHRFAACAGTRHAVAVNSGATALLLALEHFDLHGGEVIVPVETFVASASSVVLAGGVPRFVNIEPDSLGIDLEDVNRCLTPRTRGVMVVHLAGQVPPAIEELRALCRREGLFLLEDAAHAHGSVAGGRKAGSLGDAGCFSFFATKVMTCGEGGAVTTDSDALADRVRSLRNHGQRKGEPVYESVSLNYRMSELAAALALEQLEQLNRFVARRNAIAALYRSELAGVTDIEFLPAFPGTVSATWKLFVRLTPGINRDRLVRMMREKYGVATDCAYQPLCHRQPAMARFVEDPDRFRASEEIMARLICLPVFVGLEDEAVSYVVAGLRQALDYCRD